MESKKDVQIEAGKRLILSQFNPNKQSSETNFRNILKFRRDFEHINYDNI